MFIKWTNTGNVYNCIWSMCIAAPHLSYMKYRLPAPAELLWKNQHNMRAQVDGLIAMQLRGVCAIYMYNHIHYIHIFLHVNKYIKYINGGQLNRYYCYQFQTLQIWQFTQFLFRLSRIEQVNKNHVLAKNILRILTKTWLKKSRLRN